MLIFVYSWEQIFAILAFATTMSFNTHTTFKLTCRRPDTEPWDKPRAVLKYRVIVEYPFDFYGQKITAQESCNSTERQTEDLARLNFSSSAQFYVGIAFLDILYSTVVLVVYTFGSRKYTSNPLVQVLDLGVTTTLAILWMAATNFWVAGVRDIIHYSNPDHIFRLLKFCDQENAGYGQNQLGYCINYYPGKFLSLKASLVSPCYNLLIN